MASTCMSQRLSPCMREVQALNTPQRTFMHPRRIGSTIEPCPPSVSSSLSSTSSVSCGLRAPRASSSSSSPSSESEEWNFVSSGQEPPNAEKPANAPDEPMTAQAVAELMRMGSWRLARLAIPQIELLVSQIEAAFRDILTDLRPVRVDDKSGPFMYMDTMDVRNKHSMAQNLPDPAKTDAAWPRMQIENRVYESFCFRKLHIEVAVQQDGLQVLHCVMYPRNVFDVPILSLDLVAYNGRPTFAIVDACPVSKDLSLPKMYATSVATLQQKYGVETNSDIPEWGKRIFSECCIQMRPESPEDVGRFLKYTLALVHFHLQFARLALPVADSDVDRKREIYESHVRYSACQLSNDKTRQILEKRFGVDMARNYMEQMMFDVESMT